MKKENNYICGWDIGGAHLKYCLLSQHAEVADVRQTATPLWQGLETLRQSLLAHRKNLLSKQVTHALTITGELADCFRDRRHGLESLLGIFSSVFQEEKMVVFAGQSGFLSANEAVEQFEDVASANWFATSLYASTLCKRGVLIDMGSSTTDIIFFSDGIVKNTGYSDQERMRSAELVYTGIVRTPVMAVVKKVPYQGLWQSVAAENFATMADVYRISGELIEETDMMPSADGAAKDITHSERRLARMLGMDAGETNTGGEITKLAQYIAEQQYCEIDDALRRIMKRHHQNDTHIVGAGTGRFVARKLAKRNAFDYSDLDMLLQSDSAHNAAISDCATAVSVAQLARIQQ